MRRKGGAVKGEPAKRKKKKLGTTAAESEAAGADAWELMVRVPVEKVDALFQGFSLQEKMDAVCSVLQARVDGAQ